MSHKKAKDTRSDCIFRYKGTSGQLICSNYGYQISDEYLRWFKLSPWFNGHLRNGKLEYAGGFILGEGQEIIHCRSCKYYCNDLQKYIDRVNYLKERYLKKHK